MRVLDLSFDLAGRYAARLLADHGTEVVGVELPADSSAHAAVVAASLRSADLDPLRDHLNRNKSTLLLDYAAPEGRAALEELIRGADAVVHTFDVETARRLHLTADEVKALNPQGLLLTLTSYGHEAGAAARPATEKTLYAEAGGTLVSGSPDAECPLAANLPIASTIGAVYGALALLAHVFASRRGGPRGGHLDVAIRDLLPINFERLLSFYTYMKVVPYRGTRRERIDQAAAMGDFQAKDGAFHVFAQDDPYTKIAQLIGRLDLVDNEGWLRPHTHILSAEEIRQIVADGVAGQTIAELEAKGRELGLPTGPIREVDELADLPQIRFRKALLRTATGVEIEEPYRFTNFRRPHEEERPVSSADAVAPSTAESIRPAPTAGPRQGAGPLAGVRVLDLTHAYAGPSSTRILSDLGAEVIKVESVTHMDSVPRGLLPFDNQPTDIWWERAGYFADRNLGKKNLTLDMRSEEGRAIFVALLDKVDVVATNFRPRVMAGWGLGPETLLSKKPGLVVLSMSGFGGKGPDSEKPALAGLIEASSGFTSMMRHADGESPTDTGFSFGDMISGLYAALSTVMALERRDRTGQGDAIDLSCCEAPLPLMAVQLNRWARTGQRPSVRDEIVRGGRHVMVRTTADAEPQSWVLVFVAEDQEAAAEDLPGACCAVETTRAAFLEDVHSRGLVAAPLRTAEEILFDPDLNRRQLYQVVNRPSVGPLPYASAAPVLLDGQPLARRDLSPPARLGEHSAEILADLLGVSPAQYQELVERHITGEAPVGKQKSFLRWPLRMDELERRGRVRSDPAAAEKLARHFNYRLAEPTGTELKKDELA